MTADTRSSCGYIGALKPVVIIPNSVALVTGTDRPNGIGHAIVEALLEAGISKVYATKRSNYENRPGSNGSPTIDSDKRVVTVYLELTDSRAIEQLPFLYPDVTMIVNNAGVLCRNSSLQDLDKARLEMEVNYFGPLAIVAAYARLWKNQDRDQSWSCPTCRAVVNVNSIASFVSFPAGGTYAASKAAVHSLTQAQRRDLYLESNETSSSVLVMGVYPGPIDTDMIKDLPFEKNKLSSPKLVAQSIVHALQMGQEEVFPDKYSIEMHADWAEDYRGVERDMTESSVHRFDRNHSQL